MTAHLDTINITLGATQPQATCPRCDILQEALRQAVNQAHEDNGALYNQLKAVEMVLAAKTEELERLQAALDQARITLREVEA